MDSTPAAPPRSRALAAVTTLVVAASFLHAFGGNLADEDLWNHVTWGRAMLADGAVVSIDRWSYTAAGAPFFDHEWLADVLFAAVFDGAGSGGLLALKLALGLVTALALADAARTLARGAGLHGIHQGTGAAVAVPVLAALGPGAAMRPQLFTMAGLAVEWALLERVQARIAGGTGPGRPLAAVPVLLAAWANLHGGFLVGVALVLTFAGAAVVAAPRARATRLVVAAALAGVAAPLLNPYGASLYGYLGATLGMHARITEWMPIVPWDAAHARFVLLVAVAALLVVPWWWGRRGTPGWPCDWRVAFLAAAAVAAFRHQRHSVLFAIAAAPPLAVAAETWRRAALARRPALRPRRPVVAAVGAGAVLVAAVQLTAVGHRLVRDGGGIRVPADEFPTAAMGFLRAGRLGPNLLVPFEWGAYTLHHLGDGVRVFIDGRFEAVYPHRVIEDWFRFADARPGWDRALDAYPTDAVVLERDAEVRALLVAREDFVQVYEDEVAVAFVRRTPANAGRIDRLRRLAFRAAPYADDGLFP